MFDPIREKRAGSARIVWSVAAHVVCMALLLSPRENIRVRVPLPGDTYGSRIVLTYLPGGSAAPIHNGSRARVKSVEKSRSASSKITPAQGAVQRISLPPQSVAQRSPAETDANSASGQVGPDFNDALGVDNIQIALTSYSPSPKPDLSHLPRGSQGDVVLDITIDPAGKVADLQILRALGYGVEGEVAATVRTWTFHPATKDGVPVASVQELHFHFGPV